MSANDVNRGTGPVRQPAGGVDWAEIRRRIERPAQTETADVLSARQREVLRRRARAVAAPAAGGGAAAPESEGSEVLEFLVAGERYAIEATQVVEAVPAPAITPLPGLPGRLRGLANIRSRIVPAFDLRTFFGLAARTGNEGREMLVTVRHQATEFGLLVDALVGVRALATHALHRDITGLPAEYLRGVAEGGIVLLDLQGLAAALAITAR